VLSGSNIPEMQQGRPATEVGPACVLRLPPRYAEDALTSRMRVVSSITVRTDVGSVCWQTVWSERRSFVNPREPRRGQVEPHPRGPFTHTVGHRQQCRKGRAGWWRESRASGAYQPVVADIVPMERATPELPMLAEVGRQA
jgi:hypothetical protein